MGDVSQKKCFQLIFRISQKTIIIILNPGLELTNQI
jgi:hypothetical protein